MTWMNILAEIRHFPENQTPSEGSYATVVLGLLAGFVALILLVSLIRMFKRCPSNKILVIYGKTGRGAAKCVHGGSTRSSCPWT